MEGEDLLGSTGLSAAPEQARSRRPRKDRTNAIFRVGESA
jgi:hypothetical protein